MSKFESPRAVILKRRWTHCFSWAEVPEFTGSPYIPHQGRVIDSLVEQRIGEFTVTACCEDAKNAKNGLEESHVADSLVPLR